MFWIGLESTIAGQIRAMIEIDCYSKDGTDLLPRAFCSDAQDQTGARYVCPGAACAGGHPVDDNRAMFRNQHISGMEITVTNIGSIWKGLQECQCLTFNILTEMLTVMNVVVKTILIGRQSSCGLFMDLEM